ALVERHVAMGRVVERLAGAVYLALVTLPVARLGVAQLSGLHDVGGRFVREPPAAPPGRDVQPAGVHVLAGLDLERGGVALSERTGDQLPQRGIGERHTRR